MREQLVQGEKKERVRWSKVNKIEADYGCEKTFFLSTNEEVSMSNELLSAFSEEKIGTKSIRFKHGWL